MRPIYLDYAASTPLDTRVAEKMQMCLREDDYFGNPASQHYYGQQAKNLIETARQQIAHLLQADASEILWTSGATEANNLAIKGAARLYQRKGKHIITMQTEHKAVLDPCQYLEKNGYRVTYLKPETSGRLCLDKLEAAIQADTILISCMHVNNETGIIQDIEKISALTSAKNILLHVDAAQSVGKLPINLKKIPIDLLSLSAHKIYGPKGIGALYLRKKPRVRVEPLLHGGGHEQGMRAGTLATHQIVGLTEALQLAHNEMVDEMERIQDLRNYFLANLSSLANIKTNGEQQFCLPNILSVRFEGMLADAILRKLPSIAASTASACQGQETSYVLRAMGFSTEQIKSSIRFSFGRFTTEENISTTVRGIKQLYGKE